MTIETTAADALRAEAARHGIILTGEQAAALADATLSHADTHLGAELVVDVCGAKEPAEHKIERDLWETARASGFTFVTKPVIVTDEFPEGGGDRPFPHLRIRGRVPVRSLP